MFDLATAQAFLTVIPTRAERTTVMEEIRRILRPGGHLYVGDFLQNSSPFYRERYRLGQRWIREYGTFPVEGSDGDIAYLAHHFADDELEGLLHSEGFDVLSSSTRLVRTYSGREITGIGIVARRKV